MVQQQKSFLEKNFPTFFKNKNSDTNKSGRKKRSISDTTKEADAIRKKEKSSKPDSVDAKSFEEIKDYKPTRPKLPIADLLPVESKIKIHKRNIRLTFSVLLGVILAGTVFLRLLVGIQAEDARSSYAAAVKQVEQQQAINAQFQPLQAYIQQIEARNAASQEVNKLLPPFGQILNGVQTATSQAGTPLKSLTVSSNDPTINGGEGQPAPTTENPLEGACGPINNPYEKNTAPVIGCLKMTVESGTSSALTLVDILQGYPYLTEVYIQQGEGGGSATSTTGGPTLYEVTASVITQAPQEAPAPENATTQTPPA